MLYQKNPRVAEEADYLQVLNFPFGFSVYAYACIFLHIYDRN